MRTALTKTIWLALVVVLTAAACADEPSSGASGDGFDFGGVDLDLEQVVKPTPTPSFEQCVVLTEAIVAMTDLITGKVVRVQHALEDDLAQMPPEVRGSVQVIIDRLAEYRGAQFFEGIDVAAPDWIEGLTPEQAQDYRDFRQELMSSDEAEHLATYDGPECQV